MIQSREDEIILGLDVSSKCIGVCLAKLCADGRVELLEVTHCRPKIPKRIQGIEALFLKSKTFNEQFISRYKLFHPSRVVIEEPLIGSNNANTVATLLKFNAMISEGVYRELGVVPEYISSYDARKYAFPELMAVRKHDKKGLVYPVSKLRRDVKTGNYVLFGEFPFDCEKKHILLNLVSEHYPDIVWERNKNGDLINENFDASDSVVCVLGYVGRARYESTEPELIEWSESTINTTCRLVYKFRFCGREIEHIIDICGPEQLPN